MWAQEIAQVRIYLTLRAHAQGIRFHKSSRVRMLMLIYFRKMYPVFTVYVL